MPLLMEVPSLFVLFLLVTVVMSSPECAIKDGKKTTTTKTIFFIRHAESEENRRIASLTRCFRTLGKFSLPTAADVRASTELLNVSGQVDSSVSEDGAKQIKQMGQTLKDANFLNSSGIQLVVHSPLSRARETSDGMLGCVAPDKMDASVNRVVELELLKEKTPSEWTPLYWSTFKSRIADFERWLGNQPEENIALVGHSQYFKAMLGLDFKFGNCDVWQATFDASKMTASSAAETETVVLESISNDDNKGNTLNDCSSPEQLGNCWKLPQQWTDLKVLFEASKGVEEDRL